METTALPLGPMETSLYLDHEYGSSLNKFLAGF